MRDGRTVLYEKNDLGRREARGLTLFGVTLAVFFSFAAVTISSGNDRILFVSMAVVSMLFPYIYKRKSGQVAARAKYLVMDERLREVVLRDRISRNPDPIERADFSECRIEIRPAVLSFILNEIPAYKGFIAVLYLPRNQFVMSVLDDRQSVLDYVADVAPAGIPRNEHGDAVLYAKANRKLLRR